MKESNNIKSLFSNNQNHCCSLVDYDQPQLLLKGFKLEDSLLS